MIHMELEIVCIDQNQGLATAVLVLMCRHGTVSYFAFYQLKF